MKRVINFEAEIPNGYEFVKYGKPKKGEYFTNLSNGELSPVNKAIFDYGDDWFILRKTSKRLSEMKPEEMFKLTKCSKEIFVIPKNKGFDEHGFVYMDSKNCVYFTEYDLEVVLFSDNQ